MKVAVGSTNPVKIGAARLAFETLWPEQEWEVTGVPAASGISNQPMSDEESIVGARNRAREALAAVDAMYGVGLEGGLQQVGKYWFDSGWVVVVDRSGREGVASTIKLPAPASVMALIREGIELGEVCDLLFQKENSKHGDGYFGLMTHNAITRERGYADGVIAALARFLHPDLFEEE